MHIQNKSNKQTIALTLPALFAFNAIAMISAIFLFCTNCKRSHRKTASDKAISRVAFGAMVIIPPHLLRKIFF